MKKILIILTAITMLFSINRVFLSTDEPDYFVKVTLKYSFDPEGDPITIPDYESKPNPISVGIVEDHGEPIPKDLLDGNATRFAYIEDYEVENYKFIGWTRDKSAVEAAAKSDDYNESISQIAIDYDAFSGITEDTVIYALYKKVSCTVNFYAEPNNSDSLIASYTVDYNGIQTPPTLPQKYGYEFIDWSEKLIYIKNDLDVYPIYEPLKYTIKFYDYYDNLLEEKVYEFNQEINYPEVPELFSYNFIGWDPDPVYARQDRDIYARYEPVDLSDMEIKQTVEVDNSCFDDRNVANENFNKAITLAKYAVEQYGSATISVDASEDVLYTISDIQLRYLSDSTNIDLVFNFVDATLKIPYANISNMDDDLTVINRVITGDYEDITAGNLLYKLTTNISSLSAYNGDQLLDLEYIYQPTEALDTNRIVVDVEYNNDSYYVNDYNVSSNKLRLCDKNEVHILAYKNEVIDYNGDDGNNSDSFLDKIPVISDIRSYVINASNNELIILAGASLAILLLIALVIKVIKK